MTVIIWLPQLAVLAKILCLLMVVMCGAVPAMVRSVSLYSTCSSGNVTVIGRMVKATELDDQNAPYQSLTTLSWNLNKQMYIYAEKSHRYICYSDKWKIVALTKKQRNDRCKFYEVYHDSYLRYKSVVNGSVYLGFNKAGRPIKNGHGRQECFNFMKFNPNSDIEKHNNIVTKNMGVRETREPLNVQTRKPSSSLRATKNSLHADSSMSKMGSKHRHRHSNRWKLRKVDSSPRRRHGSRLRLEASKY
ncbi:uncharacterized protein LOC117174814 isoform X2 [Belonocnema kinseyi]|uniref:uncharacterized protein LOC117174814 isoform X2 n=1 Tax=Belonocnema kinseyi TaxID=2817044 RepID=UPI00143D40F2|nr:uncharacterized protein LOC117174814 isoform X2 [Belonocnema kinseyi]